VGTDHRQDPPTRRQVNSGPAAGYLGFLVTGTRAPTKETAIGLLAEQVADAGMISEANDDRAVPPAAGICSLPPCDPGPMA
jgi:hypothetical protein